MQQALLLKRGLILEYLTLGWNVVGVILVAMAAYAARSVALASFGLDSLIEIFASVIVVWHLRGVQQHLPASTNRPRERSRRTLIAPDTA